jgi:hypothetical protein
LRARTLAVFLVLVIALLGSALEMATGEERDAVIATVGKWSIHLSVDSMTDAKTCTGLYEGKYAVQLNEGKLYVNLRGRGGVSSIVLRFDNEPARPLRLATEMEQKLQIATIEGEDFKKLLESTRLRVRVLTVLDTIVDVDILLGNLKGALAIISGPKCGDSAKQAPARAPGASPTITAAAAGPPAPVPAEPATTAPVQPSAFRRVAVAGTSMSYPYTVEIPSDWRVHQVEFPKPTLMLAPAAVTNPDVPEIIGVVACPVSLADPEQVAANVKRSLKGVKMAVVKEIDGVRGVVAEFDQGDGATASTVLSLMLPTSTGCVQFLGRSPRAQFAARRDNYERILFSVRRAP